MTRHINLRNVDAFSNLVTLTRVQTPESKSMRQLQNAQHTFRVSAFTIFNAEESICVPKALRHNKSRNNLCADNLTRGACESILVYSEKLDSELVLLSELGWTRWTLARGHLQPVKSRSSPSRGVGSYCHHNRG